MALLRILPYVAILLVGQAVLEAGPAIVAEREGGMGLGSALIGALVTQIAGIVLGATLAGVIVDRRSPAAATLGGAFLTYAGLMATGIAPMGSLGTVLAGMGVAGVGFGALLTAAFSVAAGIESMRERAAAVVLLLAAAIAARVVVGSAFAAGPTAFLVGGAAVVALALVAVRLAGTTPPRVLAPRDGGTARAGAGPRPMWAGSAVLAGGALAAGTLLAVAGADPSRLSASLIAGQLGMGGFETIDTARAALFAAGMVLLLVGAGVLLAGADRRVRAAAPGLLLVGGSGSGIAAALSRAMTAGGIPDASWVLIGAAPAVGGVLGLATGGTLLARGRGGRNPAVVGSAGVAVACTLGWLTLTGQQPDPGAAIPILLAGIAGLGVGLAASALRLALTDVDPHRRGLAAGAGVVAAVIGTALGGLIGAGEGLNTVRGEAGGVAIGLLGFVLAATAAVALAATLPGRPVPPTSHRP